MAAARPPEPPTLFGEPSRRPRLVDPSCIRTHLQLPRDLQLARDEVVTARFAVGLDGTAMDVSLAGAPSDQRIGAALRAAIEPCAFVPGTDARGVPSVVWLAIPFRFGDR